MLRSQFPRETAQSLFAKITPCMENGKGGLVPALSNRVAFGSTEFHVLRPTCAVSSEWLAHFMSQPAFRKLARANMTGTAGQMRVPTKWLRTVEIPIPLRAEQTRIVEKLEELLSDLDAGVAELKVAQKKLGQYRQSLLKAAVEGALTAEWRAQHRPAETGAQLLARILTERRARWEAKQRAKFKEQGKTPPKDWQKKYPEPVAPDIRDLPELPEGWVWASVDQSCEVLSGFAFKSGDFCSEGVPVTKIANVGYGRYETDSEQEYLAANFLKEYSEFIVSSGDILVALTRPITNGTLKSCLYPDHLPASLLNQRVAALKVVLPELANSVYLMTRTPFFREAVRTSTSETLQPNMSPNALKAIAIPLPSAGEVSVLAEALEKQLAEAANQEAAINVALKQSAAQRQNILRAAFSGQLVPQDPADEPASVLLERIRAERASQSAMKKPRARRTKE